jgi:hypothetical protein
MTFSLLFTTCSLGLPTRSSKTQARKVGVCSLAAVLIGTSSVVVGAIANIARERRAAEFIDCRTGKEREI